jgi:hypothetical protein
MRENLILDAVDREMAYQFLSDHVKAMASSLSARSSDHHSCSNFMTQAQAILRGAHDYFTFAKATIAGPDQEGHNMVKIFKALEASGMVERGGFTEPGTRAGALTDG